MSSKHLGVQRVNAEVRHRKQAKHRRQPLVHQVQGTVLRILTADQKKPRAIYNFQEAGFSRPVARALVRGFLALQGGNTLETQRAVWIQIKHFGAALKALGQCPAVLPPDCLVLFDAWLQAQGWRSKTVGSGHNSISRLLRWCLRNVPAALHPRTEVFASPYAKRDDTHAEGSAPDEPLVKAILAACYADIEAIEARIAQWRQLPLSEEEDRKADLLLRLLQYGGGHIPSDNLLQHASGGPGILWHLEREGGLTHFARAYYLNADDIFPYYLAILTQCSANPQSLLAIGSSCIEPHSVRSDLERVVWDKGRSGKEQYPDFPRGKEWSAPNIVRRLLAMNEELRPLAGRHADRLFLCRNCKRGVRPPSWQRIHNSFAEFRKRHGLPDFELKSLRGAGAKLHHKAARSIASAQQRLHHESARTTQIYTPLSTLKPEHDQTIHRYQGLIVKESMKYSLHNRGSPREPGDVGEAAETVFGFKCKDLTAGIAPGTKKGEVCSHFYGCATCPGAVVPVDDPAAIARVLATRGHLLNEQKRAFREGWVERFHAVYAPILGILEQDILPAVSPAVVARAREVNCPSLPHLE